MKSKTLVAKFPLEKIKSLAQMLFDQHFEWGGEGTDDARREIFETLENPKYDLTEEEQEIVNEAVWDVMHAMELHASTYSIPETFMEQYFKGDE